MCPNRVSDVSRSMRHPGWSGPAAPKDEPASHCTLSELTGSIASSQVKSRSTTVTSGGGAERCEIPRRGARVSGPGARCTRRALCSRARSANTTHRSPDERFLGPALRIGRWNLPHRPCADGRTLYRPRNRCPAPPRFPVPITTITRKGKRGEWCGRAPESSDDDRCHAAPAGTGGSTWGAKRFKVRRATGPAGGFSHQKLP